VEEDAGGGRRVAIFESLLLFFHSLLQIIFASPKFSW